MLPLVSAVRLGVLTSEEKLFYFAFGLPSTLGLCIFEMHINQCLGNALNKGTYYFVEADLPQCLKLAIHTSKHQSLLKM